MREGGCADEVDKDGHQLATPIVSKLRLALIPAAESPMLHQSEMEHTYRGVPVASAALRRAAERCSQALTPTAAAAAPLQPPWLPAGVHRASLTSALQTLKARVAERKQCQQQDRTSTRASTQAPLSAGGHALTSKCSSRVLSSGSLRLVSTRFLWMTDVLTNLGILKTISDKSMYLDRTWLQASHTAEQ